MSNRTDSIRDFVTTKNAESMAVLEALAEADWGQTVYSTEAGQWTARDVLAHLAASEAGHLSMAERIAGGGQGVPPDFDLTRWNRRAVEKRAGTSPAELLADIRDGYARTLAYLDQVAEADLDRMGRHARGDDISVEAILRRCAEHRAQHAAEIKASLDKFVQG